MYNLAGPFFQIKTEKNVFRSAIQFTKLVIFGPQTLYQMNETIVFIYQNSLSNFP